MDTDKRMDRRTRIIGDIHGDFYIYRMLLDDWDGQSIQVGDFGIGFAGDYWHENVNDFHKNTNHSFIRGNHDNPDMCKKEMIGCIADGTVKDDVMYIGGAWSIDQNTRTPGLDWWRDEQLSQSELDMLIDVYATVKPRVMITHDCPTLAAYYMFIKDGHSISQRTMYLTRTGEALQRMFEIHQPEFHFFGHWHITKQMEINGTKFHCLGINDYVDFDLENMCYCGEEE